MNIQSLIPAAEMRGENMGREAGREGKGEKEEGRESSKCTLLSQVPEPGLTLMAGWPFQAGALSELLLLEGLL